MDLDVETGTIDGAALLTLRGEIDVYTAPRLRQAIIDLIDGGANHIVVDMEKVDFLDSTGLGVLGRKGFCALARSFDRWSFSASSSPSRSC